MRGQQVLVSCLDVCFLANILYKNPNHTSYEWRQLWEKNLRPMFLASKDANANSTEKKNLDGNPVNDVDTLSNPFSQTSSSQIHTDNINTKRVGQEKSNNLPIQPGVVITAPSKRKW